MQGGIYVIEGGGQLGEEGAAEAVRVVLRPLASPERDQDVIPHAGVSDEIGQELGAPLEVLEHHGREGRHLELVRGRGPLNGAEAGPLSKCGVECGVSFEIRETFKSSIGTVPDACPVVLVRQMDSALEVERAHRSLSLSIELQAAFRSWGKRKKQWLSSHKEIFM